MLRFLTAGESHGKALTVIIEGVPANVPISSEFIQTEMQKRKKGAGTGGRQKIEDDAVEILSGVRFGKTLGSPITLQIQNKDFKNWGEKMSSEPQDEKFIESLKVVNPRPGHADLAGVQKYNFDDVRNVLERASARETTARVAMGAICKQMLQPFEIEIASHTIQIGNLKLEKDYNFEEIVKAAEISPNIRCIDKTLSQKMEKLIAEAAAKQDTLGGAIEVWAINVPPGLGSYVHYDRKIDGQIAQAMMSIQSVKAVEIGEGVKAAASFGSEVHDEIYFAKQQGYFRKTNRAGGVEGGMTNGMPVVVRVYHKPISTLYKPLQTVNIKTKQLTEATVERSDICVVPRAGIIAESMLAFVIAQNFLEKFGGDCLEDMQSAYKNYKKRLMD